MSEMDGRSLPEVLSAVASDLATLVRKEGELVRAEVSEKISDAGKAAVTLSFGAALVMGGFLTLLGALVLALSHLMDPGWAALLVGVVAGLLGYSIVRGAAKRFEPAALAPDRTARQLRKDTQLVKEQVQ